MANRNSSNRDTALSCKLMLATLASVLTGVLKVGVSNRKLFCLYVEYMLILSAHSVETRRRLGVD